MTRTQAVEAIAAGIELVRAQKAQGFQLLATGEMGIGNTTTSSAVAAVLLGQPVEVMTGRGAGLSDAGLARKLDAIRRGIARNQPDAADPLDVLSKLGGFDIAGLCGVFLGGALEALPILMDGFISGVAALCAVRLCPAAAKAVFASHCSTEPAARLVLEALGKAPLLTAGLHLGEGTGAVASLRCGITALAVYDHCYSFTEGGIPPYTPNADAGGRRRSQRKKRVRRTPCAADRAPALLPCHDAGMGRRVRRTGGKAPPDAGGKAVRDAGVPPASGHGAPARAGHRPAGRPRQPDRQRALRPRRGGKPPLRPFWTVWTDWPRNVNTSSSFRTKCSAAGQTTRATPTAT